MIFFESTPIPYDKTYIPERDDYRGIVCEDTVIKVVYINE